MRLRLPGSPAPWLAAAAMLFLVVPRLWLVTPGGRHIDIYMMSTSAAELLQGGTLYRDVVDNRSPLYHYWFEAIAWLSGPHDLTAVNAALAVLAAAMGLWVYAIGSACGGPGAGAMSLLFFALASFNSRGSEFQAHHPEWLMVFWTSASAWCWLKSLGPSARAAWSWAAGLGLGLAVYSKQPAVLDLAAPLVLSAAGMLDPSERRTHVWRALRLLAGCAAVAAAFTAWSAWQGTLAESFSQMWLANRRIAADLGWTDKIRAAIAYPLDAQSTWRHNWPVFWGALAAAAGWFLVRIRSRRPPLARDPAAFLVLWGLSAYAAATLLSGRPYARYHLQALPVFCVLAGWAARLASEQLSAWTERLTGRRAPGFWLAVVFAAVTVSFTVQTWPAALRKPDWRLFPWMGRAPHMRYDHDQDRITEAFRRLTEFLRRETLPGERIYVWGFSCEVYARTGLRPASRYLYFNPLSGMRFGSGQTVPAAGDLPVEDPEAWRLFLGDLERSRPRFIVDATAGNLYREFRPERFAPLRRLLEERYRLERTIGPPAGRFYRIYRRVD